MSNMVLCALGVSKVTLLLAWVSRNEKCFLSNWSSRANDVIITRLDSPIALHAPILLHQLLSSDSPNKKSASGD